MSSDDKRKGNLERLFKQMATITKLVTDGKRDPKKVSRVIQLIINKSDNYSKSFLPFPFVFCKEQYDGFVRYNQWLSVNYPDYCITEKEMKKAEEFSKENQYSMLFYGHNSNKKTVCDHALTAELAIKYLLAENSEIRIYPGPFYGFLDITLDMGERIEKAKHAQDRPAGFFSARLPWEDYGGNGIGNRFLGRDVDYVIKKKDDEEWLMGFEGVQFLAITHPDYVKLIEDLLMPGIVFPDLTVMDGQNEKGALAFIPLWDNRGKEFIETGFSDYAYNAHSLVNGCGTLIFKEKIS